ncbi:ECF transporter S component [Streptococcus hillyeri]|uniref:ECF transporter S component n=1 Tax=Streptococcus hillyeri TaxID=2282420 RepID=A0A3L9DZA1_9STRE|nr:ECF transporter S component [Streptococcus hillyeri]RLY05303.1 ECF transporter S component [Streptococcus hillyeri]
MSKLSKTHLLTFMAMAIALNIVGANIALFLKLPIYLDTIGTLLMAVAFGPWLGVGTATISALINWMTTDIFSLYFAPVAIIVALMAGFLIKNQDKMHHLIWKSFLVSLPGTVTASIITVILFKGITSSGSSLVVQFLAGLGLDMTTSVILVQAGTDYLDRLISLVLVIAILKVLSKNMPFIKA